MISQLTQSFLRLSKRLTTRQANTIGELEGTIVPVCIAGEDRADAERAVFFCGVEVAAVAARRPFFTIGSAVEGFDLELIDMSVGGSQAADGGFQIDIATTPTGPGTNTPYVQLGSGTPAANVFTGTTLNVGVQAINVKAADTWRLTRPLVLEYGLAMNVQLADVNIPGRFGFWWRNLTR